MKKVFVLVLMFKLAFTATAAIYNCSDCSYTVVNSNVSLTADGDTVIMPAGSATWVSKLTITNAIYFHGAGSNQTFITSSVNQGIFVNPHNTKVPRIGNFTYNGGGSSPMMMLIGGTVGPSSPNGSAIYVDGMVFTNNAGGTSCIECDNAVGSCINSCIFVNYNLGVQVNNGGWGQQSNGDGAWADDDYFGTTNGVTIENCYFLGQRVAAVDSVKGAHWTFRHNYVTNDIIDGHGTDSSGRFRSTRAVEIYANTQGGSVSLQNEGRGGVYLIYSNTTHNVPLMMSFKDFRDTNGCPGGAGYPFSPWGPADGTGSYDSNFTGVCQLALDKIGNGKGILLTGSTPSPTGYPSQVIDICYAWANTNDGVQSLVGLGCSTTLLVNGRDYTNVNAGPVGYTPLVFPHPLVTAFTTDPDITVQPQNQTANLGQTATFNVTATGTATLFYFWYTNSVLSLAGTQNSYTTPATTCGYNGMPVYVVVSNSVSQVTSSTASLTVNGCQGQLPTYTSKIGTANIGAARF